MSQTLVLDASFAPVATMTWQKAITLIVKRAAEVVDEHPDKYIHSANWTLKMPSIIRLIKPVSKKKAVKFSRENVYARDNNRCQYCWMRVSRSEATYDHVLPRAQGGKTTWDNVVIACVPCNQRKGGRTPEQAKMHLRSTPVRPKKLPDRPREMTYASGMPASWQNWMRSAVYWGGTLESDEK